MKRYCIVPSTVDLSQLAAGEYHYLDLGSIGTGAGAGYWVMVLVDPHLPFPVEAIATFPHLLDAGNSLAGAALNGVTAPQLIAHLKDTGLAVANSPYQAAKILGALHPAFIP